MIDKTIEGFNWEKSFRNNDINGQARLLNKAYINICKNYISNKYVVSNDKDSFWLNDHRRLLIKKGMPYFKMFLKMEQLMLTTVICKQVKQN